MKQTTIIIGTRGSALALAQTQIVRNLLARQHQNFDIEVKIIKTEGDRNQSPIPLDTVGKGWFTKEIEKELIDGAIDVAVHSLKDLPEALPEELCISAVTAREDSRDVLVSRDGTPLEQLKKGAVVGTDSARRAAQILHLRRDIRVESIRGNVPTRLEKLREGPYDALVLAAAGLIRLGLHNRITQYFDCRRIAPAPGQGALAVESRKDRRSLRSLLDTINDPMTLSAVTAERAFSAAVGGGCKMPVGAYGVVARSGLWLSGMIATPDGSHILKDSFWGPRKEPFKLGEALASRMLKKCSKEILRHLQRLHNTHAD